MVNHMKCQGFFIIITNFVKDQGRAFRIILGLQLRKSLKMQVFPNFFSLLCLPLKLLNFFCHSGKSDSSSDPQS